MILDNKSVPFIGAVQVPLLSTFSDDNIVTDLYTAFGCMPKVQLIRENWREIVPLKSVVLV